MQSIVKVYCNINHMWNC